MKYGLIAILALLTSVCAGLGAAGHTNNNAGAAASSPEVAANDRSGVTGLDPYDDREFDGPLLVKTDDEWKQILTPAQYYILRQAGTEQAYTGEYAESHGKGIYYCAACGLALFRSETKFDSGTGWPSFYKVIYPKNVIEKKDTTLPGETRIEILCARCGGHLGHVFDDGPKPTGLRYCMNSPALRFQ
ncbi:MAG: peptide-methionine (R)-S-oxide reductase MsrB, partial [Pyrinomonadaceae bacterium]